MLDLIARVGNKLDDPFVMTWALHRHEHAQLRGPEHCRAVETAWFHDAALRHWFDIDDRTVLEDMFRFLPPRLFTQLKPVVAERWSGWSGRLGGLATPALVTFCPPEEVLPLLERHIEEKVQDPDKTIAVIIALTQLPEQEARRLLDSLTARISALPNESFFKTVLAQALLRPTAVLNPDALLSLTEACARAMRSDGDKKEGDRLLKAVYAALFGNGALLERAGDLAEGGYGEPLLSLQPLFASDAPLPECDRILAEPEPWPAARELLEKHRGASAVAETARAVAELVQSLDIADPEDLACFAVAAALQAFERDQIEAGSLSMEEALDVLTLDVSGNRHAASLTQQLATHAAADVARAASERMPKVRNRWGGIHLAAMAGELRLTDMIPALIDSLGEECGDFLCEAAQKALVQIGEPAASAVIARWDKLDSSQKIFGFGALEQMGGHPADRFAVERFEELFRNDHGEWCALAMAAPSEQALDLIEPEIRRKQSDIDRCFYLLCIFAGREHPSLGEVRERIAHHEKRRIQRQAAFAAGHFGRPDDSVALTLKCEKCGDVNLYEVKSVIANAEGTDSPYFVRDDLRCVSCGAWADFEFTSEAAMQIMAAMIPLVADPRAKENGRLGLLQLAEVQYRWERRPAPDVFAELKAAVAQFPHNVVNHLRLARFQYVFGRYGRAAECYGRALDLEPDSMEAGLGIAQVKAATGERRNAFDRLCKMLDRASKWRFFRTDELSPRQLTEDFRKLYNKLHTELRIRDLPLLQTASIRGNTKVGRNDPCPCGSGKKYKKCCSVKEVALSH